MSTMRTAAFVVVLLSACTRLNPAYEGDAAEQGEPTGNGATSVTDGAETRASTAGDTTSGVSGSGSSGTAGGSGLDGPLETGPACMLEFAPDYTLTMVPSFDEIFGGCPVFETMRIQRVEVNGTIVSGNNCGDGECPCAPSEITVTFDEDLPLPTLPECFDLWFRLDQQGPCEVLEYEIRAIGDSLPLFTASNATKIVGALAFNFPVEPIMDCGDCMPSPSGPGHYPLVQVNTFFPVPPNGIPTLVPGPPVDYIVVNDFSGIDESCIENVHWYAMREG
jgi:hypothetical protein